MTKTEIEHDIFEKMVGNKDFINTMISNQKFFKHGLLEVLVNEKDDMSVNFIRTMLIQAENSNVYIMPMGDFVMYFTKDFKSVIAFALRTPNPTHAKCFKDKNFVEIDTLHSNKKGNGSYLMNLVIETAEAINVPVALWSETSKNTAYYNKYNFKPYGKKGKNKEELLIRKRVPSI